jgi:hypothetical protein
MVRPAAVVTGAAVLAAALEIAETELTVRAADTAIAADAHRNTHREG